ncbi:MAG: 2-isopropylmalate synthase [Candidatus Omnitrophica bacterium CG08_land_8_20_14_0_20_41_16]|uniref:2-isopropylmalate synthase n=1 Tax=Candidatus Sherwoodlollariibacterium unditelluris TaxID=1974757 RepID=A0A2G9YJP6_9BACT|nr:MAG: 2-isopropylmalate synthase [Candidatus Omnitrophica bacterium CG23_combo_of_CG06-09_8_20_14_all_41_10]PIS33887.1 MAG: 2-isopropylmalate synthase [Candidatus Omnitrophica bacterium CG08_land_8_20_14_0_20_41_16]
MEKIIIFDTTLRDGEQAPGGSLTAQEKLEVAFQLEKLGVDVIEAGFPVASPGDFKAVLEISKAIKKGVICALARCLKSDIEAAYEAVKKARHPRIHIFLATSKIHLQYKFKKAEDEILDIAVNATKMAKKLCSDIEFSPEDATRSEHDFLYRVIEAVINEGAKTINIPDTTGYTYPQEMYSLIKDIKNNVPNINEVVIAVHCHDDLGMAVANSLSGVLAGARQVHCTINGIGERAGNASLEEVVMAIKTRKDVFGSLYTSINTKEIYRTSRMINNLTDFVVPPNKAIVGRNAFAHEAGIHQDAVLKKHSTYEIMDPHDVGISSSRLVLGKHSGRHAFRERLKTLGFHLNDERLNKAFTRFKELADKKKDIYDDDLRAIVEDEIRVIKPLWQLNSFEVTSGTKIKPRAIVYLNKKSKSFNVVSSGDGPVDAVFKAIDKITGYKAKLNDFRLEAVTSGKDALGQVSLKLKIGDSVISGRGSSTDIIEAAVKAYLDAVNKLEAK